MFIVCLSVRDKHKTMRYDDVILDDKASSFHHNYSVTQPLQPEQRMHHHSSTSLFHSAAAATPERVRPCPDNTNVEVDRATPTTTAATTTAIWSPARDIEHEQQRSRNETCGKHNTSDDASQHR